MARLKIHLFGGFRVEAEPRTRLAVSRRKGQALLALLALRPGTGYAREALTALLWPESGDEEARHSLRQELHALRRVLAPTRTRALVVSGERIALDPDAIEVDVATFERLSAEGRPEALRRAADLYEGDLMVGIGVREGEFEEHLRSERERLRARAIAVLTRLLAHQAQQGPIEGAIETALRLLVMDPTQESVHRELIRLYARSGRRAAALRQYQECVEVLQRELGEEPEAATRQLYRDLLATGGSREAPRQPSTPQSSADGRRVVRPKNARLGIDPPLVGRQAELATLREVLDQTCARVGHVVAIIGEAGVGKTRLVSEIAALAQQHDARIITGRAYETARVLALAPWVDALRAGVAMDAGALAGLEPAWRAELARILPEAEARAGRRTDPADTTRIFQAIERLVTRLASRQPLVVVLEDLHCADELTVRLAAHLGRRIDTLPVLLVLTAREEHLSDAEILEVALTELRDHARFVTVPLAALSREDTTMLTRSLARAERDAGRLDRLDEHVWRISAGNPLLVLETVRALRDAPAGRDLSAALPMRVREIVMARLAQLSEPARRVVSIASLVGRDCDFRLLQDAASLTDRDAAEVVEELVRRRVFHGVGERLDFTHDRLREVASHALLPAQRTAIHRVIATSMEALYAGDFERHYPALAAHCRDGDLWEKAVTYLTEAGTRAAERSAHREAASCIEQALEALARLPETRRTLEQAVDLRLALHTSWYAVAELERGHRALTEAQAPARKLGDPRRAALLAFQTGQSLWVTGHARDALPIFEHAAAEAKTLRDPALMTSTTLYIASARLSLGDLVAAEDGFRRVVGALGAAAGEKLGLHGLPLVFAQSGLTVLLAEQGRFDEARDCGATSVRVADALNHPYMLVFALRTLAYAHLLEGRLTESVVVLERARTLCDHAGSLSLAPNIMASLGHVYSVTGRAREGVALIEQALTTLEQYGHRVWLVVVLTQLAEACLLGGDVARARQSAQQAQSLAAARGERSFEAWSLRQLGAALSCEPTRNLAAARDHYHAALALAEERSMRPLAAHCHAGLALVHGRLGDHARAVEHRAAALEICRTTGMVTPSGLSDAVTSSASIS